MVSFILSLLRTVLCYELLQPNRHGVGKNLTHKRVLRCGRNRDNTRLLIHINRDVFSYNADNIVIVFRQ